MRVKKLIPLAIFPLLTSCSGIPISREDALSVISNIEYELSVNPATTYKSTSKTVATDSETTLVNVYSSENMFFHTYTISSQNNGRVNESWRFVMDYKNKDSEDEPKKYIFDVVRTINQNTYNQPIEKQYTITYENYSEEAWSKIADEFEDRLTRRFSDALDHAKNLLKDETTSLDLKSFNNYSLYLDSKEVSQGSTSIETEYELNVQNSQLISIKNVGSDGTSVLTEFEYSVGDILYPSIDITIRQTSIEVFSFDKKTESFDPVQFAHIR